MTKHFVAIIGVKHGAVMVNMVLVRVANYQI